MFVCVGALSAQERAATGSLEVQTTWTALRSLIDNATQATEAQRIRLDQAILCGNKGKVYAPSHVNKDSDGCLQAGSSSRLEKVGTSTISLSSKSSSNAAVTSTFAIPTNSTQLMLSVRCSVKDPDAQVIGTLTFNISNGYQTDILCDMTGINEYQTNGYGVTKYVPIPKDATQLTLKKTSSGSNVKLVEVSGIFLGQ